MKELSSIREGSFKTFDYSSLVSQLNNVARMLTMVIGSIAGISLLVDGIGVMNIMLVSVTERTREIGLRKALGATRKNILGQFLIEATLLTIIGGLIGLIIASTIVYDLSPLWTAIKVKPSISIYVVTFSIAFSALIGIIFGLIPANKASKLNPIEALRYE